MTCRFTGRFIVYVLILVCQKYMNVSHVSVLLLVDARKSRISFKCYLRHFTDQMVSATAQPCVFGGNSRRLGDAFRRQLPSRVSTWPGDLSCKEIVERCVENGEYHHEMDSWVFPLSFWVPGFSGKPRAMDNRLQCWCN